MVLGWELLTKAFLLRLVSMLHSNQTLLHSIKGTRFINSIAEFNT